MAAAAYTSCSKIYNDYDGLTHDYSRKGGLRYEHVFLPAHAPPAWKDRAVLWNVVEVTEKTKDSHLAREIIVALPVELTLEQNIRLIEEFVQTQFISDGMCADVSIHDTDGHNPHAHILLTIRPLKENGTWQAKTEKEYRCIRDGIEQGFTASEFLSAKNDGWEKQYLYSVGGAKKYLPPSQADGYERLSKHPKSSKLGRQNPITQKWNSREQLFVWRKAWADEMNRHLELAGYDVRVDHRSFKAQGIDRQPTIHEGVFAIRMERKGRKEWIENLVLEQIKKIIYDDELIEKQTDAIMEAQGKENTTLPLLRKQYADTQKSIDNMLNAIQMGILTPSTKERLESLEKQKSELSIQIVKEELSRPVLTAQSQILCKLKIPA